MSRRPLWLASIMVILWIPFLGWGRAQEETRAVPDLTEFTSPESASAIETYIRTDLDRVSARQIRSFHRWLTEEPHVAGTPRSRAVALYIARKFREFGLNVAIDGYRVLLSYPRRIELKLVEPEEIEFDLREKGFILDKDAFDRKVWLPFNGYSASGDVTGQVVYVNYGTREDYRDLEKMGVSVRGRIAMARYGRIFRGVKAMLAEEHGAVGLILYSDPRDDGYHRGDVYPNGPWRPRWAVQRGSVMHMSRYPGDPLTPGFPAPPARTPAAFASQPLPLHAEAGKPPLEPRAAGNLPAIPVMPISYGNAVKILKRMGGPVAPIAWQGGLPITYHVGPGAAKVHMIVEMDTRTEDIFNVIGWLPGASPDLVILGNHHDAWTYGAVDPSSGTAVLLEIARVLGQHAREGYRPQRTIMLAAWDGEEYGLLGSTEFVERYRRDLQKKMVAYLNCDSAVTGGNPGASAVPSLRVWLELAADRVPNPTEPGTLLDKWLARQERKRGERPRVAPLGSGSDYTAFLDFAGIPSLSLGLSGAYGVYHANIDNFYWMTRFTDAAYLWHRWAAQWLLALLDIGANTARYPMQIGDYAEYVLNALEKIGEPVLAAEHDPLTAAYQTAKDRAQQWLKAARAFDVEGQNAVAQDDPEAIRRWNQIARTVDQRFLSEHGLPGRNWFKHQIFAPGLYLGYGAKIIPAVTEALERKDLATATRAMEELVKFLQSQYDALSGG